MIKFISGLLVSLGLLSTSGQVSAYEALEDLGTKIPEENGSQVELDITFTLDKIEIKLDNFELATESEKLEIYKKLLIEREVEKFKNSPRRGKTGGQPCAYCG